MRIKYSLLTILFIIFFINEPLTVQASQFHTNNNHSKQIYNAVKVKLNLSDKDLEEASQKGKTAFDLAKERGISENELKNYVSSEAVKSIDNIVSKGLMPKFVGEQIKNKAALKIKTWDGTL